MEVIKSVIEREYGMKIDNILKIKSVYRVESGGKLFSFKIIKYVFGHFLFIVSAMKHLSENGFENIPAFIKTLSGNDYIEIDGKHAYMTEWICSRECNYDNPVDVKLAAHTLAQLHKKSTGFSLNEYMKPRVGWNRWIEIFQTRRDEILDFKRRILKKKERSEFDRVYFNEIESEIQRCERAIMNIEKSDYRFAMKKEITKHGFCHHDFANHNVLVCETGEANIIDFDYCILDTHLHDLSSFMIRTMKNGKWSIKQAEEILEWYGEKKVVYDYEIPIMAGFIEFPQGFWQIGIQYYWEEQPWGEEFFMKKLNKLLKDRDGRQGFVEELRESRSR